MTAIVVQIISVARTLNAQYHTHTNVQGRRLTPPTNKVHHFFANVGFKRPEVEGGMALSEF